MVDKASGFNQSETAYIFKSEMTVLQKHVYGNEATVLK